jgi:tRNA (mo5U34)-methyltransferase
VRQHWIDQAEFVRAIKFPRSTDIEFRRMDIAGYLNLSEERFDITIFKGIFYHLPDPIGVLGRLCDLTKETILVDTDSSDAVPESCLTAIKESKTQVMSGVDGLAWLPGGPAAIRPILEFKGFEFTEVKYWHRQTSPNKRGRFSIVGSRSPITM